MFLLFHENYIQYACNEIGFFYQAINLEILSVLFLVKTAFKPNDKRQD